MQERYITYQYHTSKCSATSSKASPDSLNIHSAATVVHIKQVIAAHQVQRYNWLMAMKVEGRTASNGALHAMMLSMGQLRDISMHHTAYLHNRWLFVGKWYYKTRYFGT